MAEFFIEFFERIFSPVTNVLSEVLMFFHGLGLPWWIAIALLTMGVRAVIFPLSVKQIKSMRAMQDLRPRLQELQEKHKDDRQKLQQEQMKLYQESGVNPLGGCLPLLVQMPIFIGIFYVIRDFGGTQGMIGVPDTEGTVESFATGGALWFTDLTQPDQLFLLPIISAVTMVAGMEITNKQMEPQQRWIMRIVPVAFVFFTIFFPAGLLVYIVTNNIFTAVQNYIIYNFGPGRQSSENKDSEKNTEQSKEISGKASDGSKPEESAQQKPNGNNKSANGSSKNGSSGNSSKRRKKKKKKS